MKKLISIAAIAVLTMFAASCQDGTDIDDNPAPDTDATLNVLIKTVGFDDYLAGERSVAVHSNRDWTVESDREWLRGRKSDDGKLIIIVDENIDEHSRTGSLDIVASPTLRHTITVVQLGWGKEIVLDFSEAEVSAEGGMLTVGITTNIDVVCESDAEWCRESATRAQHPEKLQERQFTVLANSNDESRTATVTIREKCDNESDIAPQTLTVTQRGLGEFDSPTGDIPDDTHYLKIRVVSADVAYADAEGEFLNRRLEAQPGHELRNSFDGDKDTYYLSNLADGFPVAITYYFLTKEPLDHIIYYPVTSNYMGQFQDVSIYALTDANTRGEEEWIHVTDCKLGGKTLHTRINLPEPLTGVTAVKFMVGKTSNWMISCAEMEFYKRNPDGFDYTTLFTDPSCSELRDGVTEDDINACQHSFYRSIAYYMYHDRYPGEFRINTFKCYPFPTLQASLYKTSAYNVLDNPTGISVEAGEEIVVLADLKSNLSVNLRVQNLNKPGGDGFGGQDYPITTGLNKVKIQSRGLVYVMYHYSGEPETYKEYLNYPPIKLHFASGGRVNGYYDSQDPALKDRGGELLNAAVDEFFDILGEYSHIIYPTEDLRRYTGSRIDELVYYYDRLVYNEEEFMGLKYYDKMFVNRMAFFAMYHSFAYAAQYHTSYNAAWGGHMAQLCSVETMKGSMWETAHEVGHMNQTRPGLKWIGMTECTNNIMSLYIQTAVANEESRLIYQNASNNAYMQQWNNIMLPRKSHCEAGNWLGLVPFWQLQLYFGEVLGNTPMKREDRGGFYPDVYEHIRNTPNLSHGESQAEFAYVASLCSGMDLTDFFDKHGFLKVVDRLVGDYGTAQLTVTPEYAADVRQRIADLGLDKPEVALEYITDHNKEIVRLNLPVVEGNPARWSYDVLTVQDWQNVMVYEVTDGSGNVVYVADASYPSQGKCEFKVTLPEGMKQNECQLYAVQYDNARIRVPIQ